MCACYGLYANMGFIQNRSEPLHMPKNEDHRPPQISPVPVAEEIDIMMVLRFLYARKLPLFFGGFTGAVLGLMLSFTVPDLYTSKVKVSPVSGGGMSSMLQQYGGIASLAGLTLPQGEDDKTKLALAALESNAFILDFIIGNGLQAEVLAATSWDPATGQMFYDAEYIDSEGNLTVSEDISDQILIRERLIEQFTRDLHVSEDKVSGFITLTFTHVSATFAKDVLDLLVFAVNKKLRDTDVGQAEAAIMYLEEYVKEVQYAEVKEAVYGLVQSQIETIMLANVRPEYVFRVIDGPSVPTKRASPIRALYFVLGSILSVGLILLWWGAVKLHSVLDEN